MTSRTSHLRELPKLGQLDSLGHGDAITPVGYGAQSVTMGKGGATFHYADIRYRTVGTVNAMTKTWLRASMNPSTGDGGTCYGDSGGPNFLGAGSGETDIVAATTITGDFVCRATNVDLPARHAVGTRVPRAVRQPAVERHDSRRPIGRPAGPDASGLR